MKISKKSGHFRWISHTFDPPENLCGYFWLLVLLFVLLIVRIGLILLVCLVALSFALVVGISCWESAIKLGFGYSAAIAIGVVGAVTLVICGIAYAPRAKRKFDATLTGQWLRAKKDRICPLLEWED